MIGHPKKTTTIRKNIIGNKKMKINKIVDVGKESGASNVEETKNTRRKTKLKNPFNNIGQELLKKQRVLMHALKELHMISICLLYLGLVSFVQNTAVYVCGKQIGMDRVQLYTDFGHQEVLKTT